MKTAAAITIVLLAALAFVLVARAQTTTAPAPAVVHVTAPPSAAAPTTQPIRLALPLTNQRNVNYPAYQFNFNNDRASRRERRYMAEGGLVANNVPTTQSDDTPEARPMSGNYFILAIRSIFFKGRFIPPRPPGGGDGPGRFTPAESVLVFVGVTKTDAALAAYLENTESGQIQTVHVGDQIAQGKITNITLEALQYQSGTRAARLVVGENLAGEQIYGAPVQPTTMPSGVDLSGPNADILRKMMLKRQQELNGGK